MMAMPTEETMRRVWYWRGVVDAITAHCQASELANKRHLEKVCQTLARYEAEAAKEDAASATIAASEE
jgi:hypothetical protein